MINIKELNRDLIKRANNNSFCEKRGDITEHEYHVYCERAKSWELSEYKTQKIVDKIFDYFSRGISLEANHVSVAVAGASNYNQNRLDKSDKILRNSSDFVEWFSDLEKEATATRTDKITWLSKNIIWGVTDGYNVNKEWKELAGRSRKDFETLFDALNEKYTFSKSTIPYKIYHRLIDVEEITQAPIYADNDFCAYKECDKIIIEFRMKPQRQLIFALKSRKFVWNSRDAEWKAKYTAELEEWVKTIRERYYDYI